MLCHKCNLDYPEDYIIRSHERTGYIQTCRSCFIEGIEIKDFCDCSICQEKLKTWSKEIPAPEWEK